jgi:hypothetical protein
MIRGIPINVLSLQLSEPEKSSILLKNKKQYILASDIIIYFEKKLFDGF